ncbi:DUF1330 domain-containing protein [Streptomyces griseorubiginosus]|uniref:DUF1330 domain-containing protein n=1 Tax=Streptomyces griseorubiginosus TaxID=67304 RepID=UPI00362C5893
MPAYIIARSHLKDSSEESKRGMQEYVEAYLRVVEDHPHTHLAQGVVAEVLEGEPREGAYFIQEFPSKEAALEFYHSPEYQKAVAIRQRHSVTEMILVDGAFEYQAD